MKELFIYFFFLSNTLFAQKQYNVLDWKAESSLNTYLIQQMHQQYDARKVELNKAISSKQNLIEYQKSIQQKFKTIFGDLPAKTSLNATVTGVINADHYRIEKIVYESFPHHHVTSTLYIPEGNKKFPAVLLFCGHEVEAKATISYQKTAILFAQHGFVVIMIDPVSQGERYQLTEKNGKPLTRGGTTEHTLLNESANLFGLSTPADELWDNERGLDYLVTRKEVDTTRIGCLGNSGGGMQTIYFAAFDKRIKIAAPCSYLANRERTFEISGAADGCAQMPDEGKEQVELSDYLIAMAPKPLLILAGKYDFIDYTGTLQAYDELKKVYNIFQQKNKLKLFTYDDGHGISKPKQEVALQWFRQWMYDDTNFIKEAYIKTFTEKELMATSTGQVNTSYADELSLFQRNFLLFDRFQQARKQFLSQSNKIIIEKIALLSGVDTKRHAIQAEDKGEISNSNFSIRKMIIRKEQEIPLPLLFIKPENKIQKIVIWLNEDGKNKIADSISLIQSYLKNNCAVVLADIRGIGETEDKAEFSDPKYFNKEYRNAMLALHIGRSLVGQRTNDVLTILQFIQSNDELNKLPVELNATGIASLPALQASIFDKTVTQLNLFKSIHSFKEILSYSIEKNWYSWIIPGVLKYYDIPDLIELSNAKVNFQ
jgi:dienelactone hydrolase